MHPLAPLVTPRGHHGLGLDVYPGIVSADRSEQEHVAVAVTATAAEAEFVKMSLIGHGIPATTSVSDPAHPSLDFAQGMRVFVPAEDEEEALELLGRLHADG